MAETRAMAAKRKAPPSESGTRKRKKPSQSAKLRPAAGDTGNKRSSIPAQEEEGPSSPLLRLPPELRNHIYEYCLLERNPIRITPQLQQPSLLRTCRQIRSETIALWYGSDHFRIQIYACDASLYVAFYGHVRQLDMKHKMWRSRTSFIIERGKDWANLLDWCKASWARRASGLQMKDNMNKQDAVIAAAHSLVREHRKTSWEECEKALKALHFAVVRLDPGWAI